MKMKIMLIFIIIFCFGCTANYHLKINEDLTVEETIKGFEKNEYYDSYYRSSKDLVVQNAVALHQDYLDKNNYSFHTEKEDSKYGAVASLKYSSLDDYYKRSKVYEQYFNNWSIKKEKNIITIDLSSKKKPNGTGIDGRYTVSDGDVSINLPFKVLKHNADKVKNNTYIWNINSFKGKKIYLKFDSKKNNETELNFIGIIVIGIIVLIASGIIILFIKKNKEKNEF